MLAIVLGVVAPSWGTISFSSGTLTYSSTSDLSSTIDPSGQKEVTNEYGVGKSSFQALNPQVVAFPAAPTAAQSLRYLVVNYDASNTVTFTFPSIKYNYGSKVDYGRGSFSGPDADDAFSSVAVQDGSLYDWLDATISTTGGIGVRALGFCAAFRNDQAAAAGQMVYTLSDASTETINLPALGGSGNPKYVFIGYQAPAGKTITRVQGTTSTSGLGVAIDDLSFVMSSSNDTTAPAAVTDLSCNNIAANSIQLNWTAPGDDGGTGMASSYDIRHRTDHAITTPSDWDTATPVVGEPIPQVTGSTESKTITGLSPNTTYYFALKTSDEIPNWSAISNSPSGQTLAPDTTAPSTVSDLATSDPTANSITLTWTAPGGDGSTGTASSYDIRYATSAINEDNWAGATQVTGEPTPTVAGTSQNMTVNGLSASTTYFFALKTADEAPNVSAISNSPSGTTATLPPSGILALKRDPGLVVGGEVDARFANATVVNTTVEDATLYGIQNSRWYNGGCSLKSVGGTNGLAHNSFKFNLAPVPAYAKVNLAQLRLKYTSGATGFAPLSMNVTHDWIEGIGKWNVYPGAAGGITHWAPIAYNTSYSQNPSGTGGQPWGGWGSNSDSAIDVAVDGGPPITAVHTAGGYLVFDVTAHVQAWMQGSAPNFGWIQKDLDVIYFSESIDEQPVLFIDYSLEGDMTPPATVADLTTPNVTNRSVTLNWTAPGDDGSTGTASSYQIRYDDQPIDTPTKWALATPVTGVPAPQAAGTNQSAVVSGPATGLLGNTMYYFAMQTADEVSNTSGLAYVSATTLPDTVAPAAVTNLVAGNPTNHSLMLTWTAPGDDNNDAGTAAATYDIRYSTSPIDEGNWASATPATDEPVPAVAGTSQSLLIDNLDQNTTYYFAIKTSDEALNTSGLSNVATNQVLPDITAPGAVTSLTVTKTKSSALRLAWIAAGDDGAERTATSYDIRYRTDGPVTEGNWASCTQVPGEPATVQPGYHRTMWIYGLAASTTYYIGLKALDEVSNASTIATASATTPAATPLARRLLRPDDLQYLGAFKLPQSACGRSTVFGQSGLAMRRVNGNLQFLTGSHVGGNDAIYEVSFPGLGAEESTWPQATILREWGTAVYGDPMMMPTDYETKGLSYDQATGRLYFSFGHPYYVSGINRTSLGSAVLNEDGSVTVIGQWQAPNVHVQVMRGGSLMIPDWFADAYLGRRKLGVGFGGSYSGWGGCSPGPALAAAHHPDASQTELDTIRLVQYEHEKAQWGTRDGGYWWRNSQVYDGLLPDGDIGYSTSMDSNHGAAWIDLPDKQGLLYLTGKAYGAIWYDYGVQDSDRKEYWWRVYDPQDLAEVAAGNLNHWEPQHDEWPVTAGIVKQPTADYPRPLGMAFDAQTRTLFVLGSHVYKYGGESFPAVYGYRIHKTGDIIKDGYVNVGDLQALVAAWASQAGPPASGNWNADADINADGFVNVGDLQQLVAYWGE